MLDKDILVVTTDNIPGKEIIDTLGVVFSSGSSNANGGCFNKQNIKTFENESKQEAVDNLILMAKDKNANAIIDVRFSTTILEKGIVTRIYGTAVRIK